MTVELFFVAASFVVGVGQVTDAMGLVRRHGLARGRDFSFALFESLWAAFCLFLLLAGHLTSSRWLAIMFLAYLPVSLLVTFVADPRVLSQNLDTMRLPMSVAYLGGFFGGLYSLAAVIFLVGL
jgi:hypothetical protein